MLQIAADYRTQSGRCNHVCDALSNISLLAQILEIVPRLKRIFKIIIIWRFIKDRITNGVLQVSCTR